MRTQRGEQQKDARIGLLHAWFDLVAILVIVGTLSWQTILLTYKVILKHPAYLRQDVRILTDVAKVPFLDLSVELPFQMVVHWFFVLDPLQNCL